MFWTWLCKQNDLDLWYNPTTTQTRCECNPEEPYSYETRQRYAKLGFQIDPPVKKEFYGENCEFHCPHFNGALCNNGGSCDTRSVSQNGRVIPCTKDETCSDIDGAFCGRDALPWDTKVTPGQFFFNAPHPGFQNCRSDTCLEQINSIDYESICLQNAYALYPIELNTDQCVFAPTDVNDQEACRSNIETFFTSEFNNTGETWCDMALRNTVSDIILDTCSNTASNTNTVTNYDIICSRKEDASICALNENCIYDNSLANTQRLTSICNGKTQLECEQQDLCTFTNNTCVYKSLCRALTCEDTIKEIGVEQMCNAVTAPFAVNATVDWNEYCYDFIVRTETFFASITPRNTLYYCWNWKESFDPSLVTNNIRGGVRIQDWIIEHKNNFLNTKDQTTCYGNQTSYCQQLLQKLPTIYYLQPSVPTSIFCDNKLVFSSFVASYLENALELLQTHYTVCNIVEERENTLINVMPFAIYTNNNLYNATLETIYDHLAMNDDVLYIQSNVDIMRKDRPLLHYLDMLNNHLDQLERMSFLPTPATIPSLCDYNICG